jgi:hypothetical protein
MCGYISQSNRIISAKNVVLWIEWTLIIVYVYKLTISLIFVMCIHRKCYLWSASIDLHLLAKHSVNVYIANVLWSIFGEYVPARICQSKTFYNDYFTSLLVTTRTYVIFFFQIRFYGKSNFRFTDSLTCCCKLRMEKNWDGIIYFPTNIVCGLRTVIA